MKRCSRCGVSDGAHMGDLWSVCVVCEQWNWCSNFPFTHVPICCHCWNKKFKTKGLLKELLKKFAHVYFPEAKFKK